MEKVLWKYEFSELDAMRSAQATFKKSFIAGASDSWRQELRHPKLSQRSAPSPKRSGVAQQVGQGEGMFKPQFSSPAARLLAWLIFLPPLRWVGELQRNFTDMQLRQIFKECGAEPISVAVILRGPQSSSSCWPIHEPRGGLK